MPATPAKKTAAKKAAPAKKAATRVAAKPPVRKAPANDPFGKLQADLEPASKYNLGVATADSGERLWDLKVPSGALCQVRRPGVPGLVAAGILDSVDSLSALVQTEHIAPNDAKGQKAGAVAIANSPDAMAAGFALVDKLTAYTVVQPAIWVDYRFKGESDVDWNARQQDAEARRATKVSDVDIVDRLFIMQWAVGGSDDLKAFREGFGSSLDDLARLQGLPLSAE